MLKSSREALKPLPPIAQVNAANSLLKNSTDSIAWMRSQNDDESGILLGRLRTWRGLKNATTALFNGLLNEQLRRQR